MAATTADEFVDGCPQGACQSPDLRIGQSARRPGRVQTCPPEHLVGDQVAHPRQMRLIQEPGLQGCRAAGERRPQRGRPDRQRVRSEPGLVGIKLDAAEPARIPDGRAGSGAAGARTGAGGRIDPRPARPRCSSRAGCPPPAHRRGPGVPSCRTAGRGWDPPVRCQGWGPPVRCRRWGPAGPVSTVGPAGPVSRRRSLPIRRAAVKDRPIRASRTVPPSKPRFRYHGSGVLTSTICRPTPCSANRR